MAERNSDISIFSPDYQEASYWLENPDLKVHQEAQPPTKTDLLVIGSGYTGLNAAIQAARNGIETLVIDEGELGSGCSTKMADRSARASSPL